MSTAAGERFDVVVVGAGVWGSATARSLGMRGVNALLLEQFELGHARGSSHGPVRIFRISYPHPDYSRMARRALGLWRELEDAAGEELLVTTGGLDVGPAAEECRRSLEACGVESEVLDAGEAARRFPAVGFEGLGPILYQADAGVCRADRTVAAQVRVARELGVQVRDRTPVTAVLPDEDGVTLRTEGGDIRARAAVVTAGSWANQALGAVIPEASLTPVLQHIAYFGPRVAGAATIPTFIQWSGPPDPLMTYYALPDGGVAPGVKVGEHAGGTVVDPSTGPFPLDPARVDSLSAYVRTRFPGLDPEPLRPETCLYTMTPDEDFVLDRVGPVVIGAGGSGHGFKFGPLIGEALADLAIGHDPGIPTRFGANRPGLRDGGVP